MKVNQAITYTDLPIFVRENLEKLQLDTMAEVVAKARYDDLCRIKEILISGEQF